MELIDPNKTLEDARDALARIRKLDHDCVEPTSRAWGEAIDKLADAFEALDGWMSNGGTPPAEWADPRNV